MFLTAFVVLVVSIISTFLYFRFTRPKWSSYTTSEEAIKDCDLSNKITIVTGSNSGIGKEIARCLLKLNCKVIMACRNKKKALKAKESILSEYNYNKNKKQKISNNIEIMILDLNSLKSIYSFYLLYKSLYKKLDLLINNAGIILNDYIKTKDNFEGHFGINHIGTFYLTQLLTPLLKTHQNHVLLVFHQVHIIYIEKKI